MRNGRLIGITPGVACLALLASLGATCRQEREPADREAACRDFLTRKMMTADGAFLAEGKTPRHCRHRVLDEASLAASGVLSESVGLWMLYAVDVGDRTLLDQQFKLLQARLLSQFGLVYWKLSADLDLTADANASVDDLRIAQALVLAYERWNDPRYLDQALDLAANLRKWCVKDGVLLDYVSWRDYGPPAGADAASLAYLDLEAMRSLVPYDAEWAKIRVRAAKILAEGQTDTGLFYAAYDPAAKKYGGEEGNAIHLALAASFLADAEPQNHRFLDFVREQFGEEGKLYAQFNAVKGEATQFFESTSVYAICSMLARRQGDGKLADRLLERMKESQNLDPESPLYGAFCDAEVFSFDNLQALRALRMGHDARQTGK